MQEDAATQEADVRAAFYAAARLVWAKLSRGEHAARESDAALTDLWTGDDAADDERAMLLVEALVEYAAFLARKGARSASEARDEAFMQVWAMIPDDAAADALLSKQLDAADDLIARHAAAPRN